MPASTEARYKDAERVASVNIVVLAIFNVISPVDCFLPIRWCQAIDGKTAFVSHGLSHIPVLHDAPDRLRVQKIIAVREFRWRQQYTANAFRL
jgi:hypothetical protein